MQRQFDDALVYLQTERANGILCDLVDAARAALLAWLAEEPGALDAVCADCMTGSCARCWTATRHALRKFEEITPDGERLPL